MSRADLYRAVFAEESDIKLEIERQQAVIAELVDALKSAILQVEYMHRKFSETGSGNVMIAGWRQIIAKHEVKL